MDEILKKKIEFEIIQIDEHISKSSVLIKAVLSEGLKAVLFDYMNFRHFFRHSYGYSIKWDKVSHLFLGLESNWNKVKFELNNFIAN